MKNTLILTLGLMTALFLSHDLRAAEPDYSDWQRLLDAYYDPVEGMDYGALKRSDSRALSELRKMMAAVDVDTLDRNQQLAYWINLYNISVVGVVVDHYPVDSIRDISTDPIIRLNVFKKDYVFGPEGRMSLDDVEHSIIRERFRDPRIHFAVNCAAVSCPPIRPEPYVGDELDEQLDDQTRKFLNGPDGIRLTRSRGRLTVHTTKIMDWFEEDFEPGGGNLAFIRRYVDGATRRAIDSADRVRIRFHDYDWDLNDR